MRITSARMLRQAWRSSAAFNRSPHNAFNFRGTPPNMGAHLVNSPCFLLHPRELVEVSQSQIHPSVFHGGLLREQIHKNLNDNNDWLYLDQIRPPKAQKITVEDAKRLVKFVRLEAFKRSLHQIREDSISYGELLQVCMESVEHCSKEEAMAFSKLLDESGHILVVGHAVHLRPDKVARAFEEVMPPSLAPMADPRREELANLKKVKAEIDLEVEKRVMAESWSALVFLVASTAVFVRWTFWDLSWDVMEPICFFVTSFYFIAKYGFFLRTSTAPTFAGFFNARFQARQRQLMKKRNFDVQRFQKLQMLSTPRFK